MDFLMLFIAFIIGVFPNEWVLKFYFSKEQLNFVRSDYIGTSGMWEHSKEPRFIAMFVLDFIKGLLVVFLALQIGAWAFLPTFALFVALIAHNFNIIKGFRNGIGALILLAGFLLIEPWVSLGFVLSIPFFRLFLKNFDLILVFSTMSIVVISTGLTGTISGWLFSLLIFIFTIAYKTIYYQQMHARSFNRDYIKRNPFVHKNS